MFKILKAFFVLGLFVLLSGCETNWYPITPYEKPPYYGYPFYSGGQFRSSPNF